MVAELAPDAVFHSPVADYEGRDRIGAVLTAVTQVVAVLRRSHLIEGSDETLLAFTPSSRAAPATACCWRPASVIERSRS